MSYTLLAQIRNAEGEVVETFELAPAGDGLCIGFQFRLIEE